MNARTLAIATLMIASTLAFAGTADADLFIERVDASCTTLDPVHPGCLEQTMCEVRDRVTGEPGPCIR